MTLLAFGAVPTAHTTHKYERMLDVMAQRMGNSKSIQAKNNKLKAMIKKQATSTIIVKPMSTKELIQLMQNLGSNLATIKNAFEKVVKSDHRLETQGKIYIEGMNNLINQIEIGPRNSLPLSFENYLVTSQNLQKALKAQAPSFIKKVAEKSGISNEVLIKINSK